MVFLRIRSFLLEVRKTRLSLNSIIKICNWTTYVVLIGSTLGGNFSVRYQIDQSGVSWAEIELQMKCMVALGVF